MDADAFDAFYAGSFPRVVGQVYAMCGNLAEAQDCVQEAFVRGWDRRRALQEAHSPEAWVRTVADTIRSWVQRCSSPLFDRTEVDEIGAVHAGGGTGSAWLLIHTPVAGQAPDVGELNGTAVGTSGSRVVLISQTQVGQDYNYEAGGTPIEGALAVALDRLAPG